METYGSGLRYLLLLILLGSAVSQNSEEVSTSLDNMGIERPSALFAFRRAGPVVLHTCMGNLQIKIDIDDILDRLLELAQGTYTLHKEELASGATSSSMVEQYTNDIHKLLDKALTTVQLLRNSANGG